MPNVPFPVLSAPGRLPQAAGGRLVNTFPEKQPETAGTPFVYWRVPGLKVWGISGGANFRGALVVGAQLYAVIDTKVYVFNTIGGAGTPLTGTLPGTTPVIMARNNAATPDVVIVAPGDGAFIATSTAVSSYPDADVGQPNAVVFHRGFFIFTYGDGTTFASGVNSTSIATTDFAKAESKPDTLYRPIPLGNGQLLLCGSATMEVWGGDPNVGVAGYPFVYIATIARGIVGPYAIAGHDDGWGNGIFLVGDDFRVSRLDNYQPVPISNADLDLLINNEPVKSNITVSVYSSMGHGFVVIQGATWCWEFDTTLNTWHERRSYLKTYWRGRFQYKFLEQWICGDKDSGQLAVIDGNTRKEFGVYAVQSIATTGGPTGGSFTLTFGNQTTAAIPYNATAAQVQTALTNLSNVGAGNITCTGGALPSAIAVQFWGSLGPKPQPLLVAFNSLTGGTAPAVSISTTTAGVDGDPLRMRIETGPIGAFPATLRINAIELYLTKGAGVATGIDPVETDPMIEISISRNGGQAWSSPRLVRLGLQALTAGRVRAAIWGQAEVQGVRWRFDESAGVPFGFMGADMQVDKLK